jgi:hypothetical protein
MVETAIPHQRVAHTRAIQNDGTRQRDNAHSYRSGAKAKPNPACDRHPNLQMEATSFMTPRGGIIGYICPVPSCGRHYDGLRYFEGVEVGLPNHEDAHIDRRL